MRGPFTKPVKSLQILALLALVPGFILGAAAPADDFYLVRLQAGKAEAAAGRPYEAIDDLKIASFGFLDQPALLIEGLSRLALAQAAAGRNDDAEATLRRMVEIERRYDGWAQADLEPGTRAAVAAVVGKKLGADAAKLLEMPVATPVPAATPTPTAIPTPLPAPLQVPAPPPVSVIGPASPPASAAILVESKSLVNQGRYVENLRRLVAAVAASPGDRELRKALLEGAALTKDWGTAVAQLEPLRPFRDGEEPWMFYGAVALSETGKAAEARDLAEKALPRLSRSPFVDYYARKIVETAPKR
jgi:tetratricopeptide (TPR) repeat protein